MRTAGLEESWARALDAEFDLSYMRALSAFLLEEATAGKQIFPTTDEIFSAFSHTPLDSLKVVILGQDPYHGPEQAHGLCFSVKRGVPIPPSLKNVYRELQDELGLPVPTEGDLTAWADGGVLLLNSVLTVESGRAASHQGKGWETFTDQVIQLINKRCEGVVFMLWGSYAQRKGSIIDTSRHCVLKSPHPSPLSAYRGFFGCGHFLQANDYLESQGREPVDWSLPVTKG
ncbi:MAG: uracil-DNA glycosylase [Halioglobus sp.]